MSDSVVAVAFTRTSTKVGRMEIVTPAHSPTAVAAGIADGTLEISFGGCDCWGRISKASDPEQVVARILDAEDDASGAVYGNLQIAAQSGDVNA